MNFSAQAYESLEVYIDSKIYLVGPKDGPTFELQPGTYKYNFSYQLPEKLPATINLKYGNIAYFVEAVPDIPWMFNKEIKFPFVVARCDDLNLYRNLKEPLKIVETKAILSNTPNDIKLLRMTVMLPCSGFVANQMVSMTMFYENDSDTNVLKTTVTFNQKVEFRSSTIPQLKIEEYSFVEIHAEGVDAKKSKSIPISFKIPNVASSNRKFCRIITVSYYIEVLADLGREHASLKVKIPIIIGDIAIRCKEENLVVEPSAPPLESLSGIISELLLALPSAPPLEISMDDLRILTDNLSFFD